MRKTKIICTYGPAIDSPEMIEKVINAGVNIIRFNFSHGDYEYHAKGMNNVKMVREKLGLPIGILLDTKGPEIRTGTQDQEWLELVQDSTIELNSSETKSVPGVLAVDYERLVQDVKIGTDILLDDGKCRLKVEEKIGAYRLVCRVLQGGSIKQRRSLNIPNAELSLPFLSEKDKKDLEFGAKMDVDIVAASFTRTATDIKKMRSHLFKQNNFTCDIVAKIENRQGVKNINDICSVADGIMVARGDLGVELPVEEVPHIQKMIINICRKYGKPVITATQMLESMMTNTHPTRAEVSDIANAIYDSTSAIMLSGETAAGKYPVECVKMMSIIAKRTESEIDYRKMLTENLPQTSDGTKAMANAALTTAYDLNAAAIVALTSSGYCARLISRRRPEMAIIAPTDSMRSYYKMALYWGVMPVLIPKENFGTLDEVFDSITKMIEDRNILPKGSQVVQLGGSPVGVSGSTNVLRISSIGNVATRGVPAVSGKTQGLVHIFKDKISTPEDRVIVMKYLMEGDLSVLKRAKALILQSDNGEEYARVAGETLNIPVITRAEGCITALYDNEMVLVNADEGVVYRNPSKFDTKV
jgi:pyruvate kinase